MSILGNLFFKPKSVVQKAPGDLGNIEAIDRREHDRQESPLGDTATSLPVGFLELTYDGIRNV